MNDIIFRAIDFAAKAHTGQYRKGTKIPYIFHPINVAQILLQFGYADDIVCAGLLHDTIEDTPVTPDTLGREFNKSIVELVLGASEKDKKDTWDNRKKETIEKLSSAPIELLALACADKLDNIRAIRRDYDKIGDKIWERFKAPADKQKWYYQSLASVYRIKAKEHAPFPLAEVFIAEVEIVFGSQA